MAKKKGKPVPRNLSLRDRLAGHWENGKWENFVALYLRDREASDRTPWAERLGDALYNCLTKALFVQRDTVAAPEFAVILRTEAAAGRAPAVLGDCARVALDFLTIRKNPLTTVAPLADEAALPQPYARLRAALASPRSSRKGRAAKSPAAKLADRFEILKREGGLAPCTNFFKAAEELEKLTRGTDSAPLFAAVRAVASLLRELQRKNRSRDGFLRNPQNILDSPEFAAVKAAPPHPALLGLWGFFRERGRVKFGADWAAAVGVMPLLMSGGFSPELTTSFKNLFSTAKESPKLLWAAAAEKSPWPWSEQERYLLASFCLYAQADPDNPPLRFRGDSNTAAVSWLNFVSSVGGRRRAGRPWPPAVVKAFEIYLIHRGELVSDRLPALTLPFADLTSPALAYILIWEPNLREPLRQALRTRRRWPLTLTARDKRVIADDLAASAPSASALEMLREAVRPEDYSGLMEQLVETVVEGSAVRLANLGPTDPLPWDALFDILETVAAHLPEDSPAMAFTRLVRDRRALAEEPKGLQTLFDRLSRRATRSDQYAFSGNLFILMIHWPEVSAATLARLFDLGRTFFFETDLWRKPAEALASLARPSRRQSIAAAVAEVLRKPAKRRPYLREALKAFEALAAGRPLPPEEEKIPLGFGDKEFFETLKNFFENNPPPRKRRRKA